MGKRRTFTVEALTTEQSFEGTALTFHLQD
jgi:hypothetical protein